MASKNYVVINGRAYNTITGMVMDDIKIEKSEIEKEQSISKRGTSVSNIHAAHVQKSSTLNRRHVKMPQRTPLAAKPQKARVDVKQHIAVKSFLRQLSASQLLRKLLLTAQPKLTPSLVALSKDS